MSDTTIYDPLRRRWFDADGTVIEKGDARLDGHFRSHVNHHPTFFVPDTGAEGGSAVLRSPKGAESTIDGAPVGSDESTFGKRLGFEVPRFTYPGEYTLTVDDGSVYTIEVLPTRRTITDRHTGKPKIVNTVEEAIFFGGDEGEEEIVP